MTRRLLSVLAAALVLCSCGSDAGEGISGETVSTLGRVRGRGPQDATGRVELAPKRAETDCGRDERSEVSPGIPSPAESAAAEWCLGTSRLYPETVPAVPKAPRGYVPVYLSHYGRHGSRYLVDPGQYKNVYEVLSAAAAEGKLTEEGERVWQFYSSVYPSFDKHEGELTPLGAAQHRAIAARMVQNYPRLFRSDSRIEANSTNLERTMLSMQYFTQGLLSLRPKLRIHADASRSYMGRINQHTLENPRATEYDVQWKKGTGLWRPAFEEYAAGLIDPEPFCGRLFTDYPSAPGLSDPLIFIQDFFDVAANLPSCGLGYEMLEAFTEDELQLLGRLDNYRFYVSKSRWPGGDRRGCYLSEAVLGDIIDRTAEDLADGVSVRLRFGHDGCMMALFALMKLEGWDAEIEDLADAWKVWDVSRIPMAGNFQMVLFAPRRSAAAPREDDLLVMLMLNEEPLSLPLTPVSGNCYRWTDFISYCTPLLDEAREALAENR